MISKLCICLLEVLTPAVCLHFPSTLNRGRRRVMEDKEGRGVSGIAKGRWVITRRVWSSRVRGRVGLGLRCKERHPPPQMGDRYLKFYIIYSFRY